MWSPEQHPIPAWTDGKVIPKTVLYYYDGPTVFTADVGLSEFLFYKFDEAKNADFFIIAPTTEKIVGALESQSLSVRGALESANEFWVVELARDQAVRRCWKVGKSEIAPYWLPEFGLALEPRKVPAADFVQQVFSFFSARFTGENLTETSIPFMRFKTIIDSAYDSFRKIFPAPVVDNRSLSRSLEFGLMQPKFSSLIIAIDRPTVDIADAKKYIGSPIDDSKFSEVFEKNRQDFFDRMSELLTEADKGEIKRAYAVEHFRTLQQVNDIVPTSSNALDRVEFRSEVSSLKPLEIDDRLGTKIRLAHRLAEHAPREIVGVVVEINDASGTFVIRNEHGRQATCVSEVGIFNEESIPYVIGTILQVRGIFTKRPRRDLIQLTERPRVLKRPR